jgi:hypothetical protein
MKLTRAQFTLLQIYSRQQATGWKLANVLRVHWWRWLLLGIWAIAGSWYLSKLSPWAAGLVAGLGAGAFLRDIGHLQVAFHVWPLTREIIHWQRVSELIESHEKDAA